MGFKLSAAISIARGVLNDRVPDYRYEDADLLEYGNGALRTLATLKPPYLYADGEVACIEGKCLQSVSFTDAHALVEVKRIKNGNALLPFDKPTLDAFNPAWQAATAAAATGWAPHLDNPIGFWLDKPAPTGQIVEVTFVRIPGPYAATDDTGLPETITEAVADYIVGMAESRDDDHVNSSRAAIFTSRLAERLGIAGGKA